jgi:hypothetical protein
MAANVKAIEDDQGLTALPSTGSTVSAENAASRRCVRQVH